MTRNKIIVALLALFSTVAGARAQSTGRDARPNIILILSDDLGYSDIGCFGGEIPTPNLDRLAEHGLRLAQFYNHARCCPTRASLLTGLDNHQTGIGNMTANPKKARHIPAGYYGYTGQLNFNCVTIADVLKTAGYHTYMCGKWHLGFETEVYYPHQRGFEKFYGFLGGATNYFHPKGPGGSIHYNNDLVSITDPHYYTSNAFTDSAISFIREQQDAKPFFLYLAFNAAHVPLRARPEDIAKVKGLYDKGWDVVRRQRFEKVKQLGLVSKELRLSAEAVTPWNKLTAAQQQQQIAKMTAYAAIIYNMDQNIGRLLSYLKQSGRGRNTLIIYLSDNGATFHTDFWNMCDAPFLGHKRETYEGGIAANTIVSWPAVIPAALTGKISQAPGDIIDIMPTLAEVSGAAYPAVFKGHPVQAMEGHSLLPVLTTGTRQEPRWFDWEHDGNYAVRSGSWKAVKPGAGAWELYNITADRGETTNLADRFPGKLDTLTGQWQQWAKTHYVFPKPPQEHVSDMQGSDMQGREKKDKPHQGKKKKQRRDA